MPIAEVDDAFFDAVMDLNVRSLVAACSAAVPFMRKGGHGNIINVTSDRGAPRRRRRCGDASRRRRASISTFTRGMAKELVKDNIRVNAVSARRDHHAVPRRYSTPAMLESFKTSIPMGRLGTAEECVGAFLFLASDALSGLRDGADPSRVNGGQYAPDAGLALRNVRANSLNHWVECSSRRSVRPTR